MNDIELIAIGSGLVYAIGRALQREPNKRETIRYTKVKHPQATITDARPARLTTHRYPVRVPIDTRLHTEPRNATVQPRETVEPTPQRKQRAHRGTGPFGMTQAELKTAQKYLRTGGQPVEYDEAVSNNGWIVGLSEGETVDGTCEECQSNGISWDTPTEEGTCYECHAPLTGLSESEGE